MMNRRSVMRAFKFSLGCICLMVSCSAPPAYRLADNAEVNIIASSNTLAEVNPCGCATGPVGGFERRLNYIQKDISANYAPIQIDAGDLLFSSRSLHPEVAKDMKAHAKRIILASNVLGQTVFVPGEIDFVAGKDFLLQMAKLARFKFISVNLLDEKTKQPLFEPSMVVERAHTKVGIVGGLEPRQVLKPIEGVTVTPLEEPFLAEVAKLKSEVKVLIGVVHGTLEQATPLMEKAQDIGIWVISDPAGRASQGPRRGTVVVSGRMLGQAIARVQIRGSSIGHQLIELGASYAGPNIVSTMIKPSKSGGI